MQMTERKTQYLPSVPDLPMDFAHVFQGKVDTLLQSTFSSYTNTLFMSWSFMLQVGTVVYCHS